MALVDNSLATGIAVFACSISLGLLVVERFREPPQAVLIYNSETIATEIQPYVAAGQEPFAVINAAIDAAVAQGNVVVDTRTGARGPDKATLHLADFVAIGGSVGRIDQTAPSRLMLEGTTPIAPSALVRPTQQPAEKTVTPEEDVRDFAKQLFGDKPAFAPKNQ